MVVMGLSIIFPIIGLSKPKDCHLKKGRLENEINIQRLLHNKDYPVPKPYGIFPVEIESRYIDSANREVGGFFMERIHGASLDMVEGDITPLMKEASNIVASIEKMLE
jgi:hypothetical protein